MKGFLSFILSLVIFFYSLFGGFGDVSVQQVSCSWAAQTLQFKFYCDLRQTFALSQVLEPCWLCQLIVLMENIHAFVFINDLFCSVMVLS
ncbi:hypothetical protein BJ742DRAFT_538919 [Cladochytrium replicatum]|nr:hypothetical protein BJ742DRAFT_538919 [Cladochytrium replicatum]